MRGCHFLSKYMKQDYKVFITVYTFILISARGQSCRYQLNRETVRKLWRRQNSLVSSVIRTTVPRSSSSWLNHITDTTSAPDVSGTVLLLLLYGSRFNNQMQCKIIIHAFRFYPRNYYERRIQYKPNNCQCKEKYSRGDVTCFNIYL
jgi:hypothetical protein